jgi:peptide/nickel transport system permease protein
MQRYILGRIVQAFFTLWALSFIIFISAHLTGDPALILLPPEAASEEDYQLMKKKLGLDKSKPEQYLTFMKNAIRLDFGLSTKDFRPARDILLERLPATIQLSAAGMLLAIVVGVPLGILAAVRQNSIFDQLSKFFAVVGMAAPQFWVAIMLILFFGAYLKVLPTYGRGGPDHFILPAFVLSWSIMAGMMRLGRSAMLEILDSEFIKFARVKGLRERLVLWKHALRNAMIPLLTFGGISLAGLLNGSVVVEVVFAWPGVGRLLLEGVVQRNFPIVQATVLISGLFYVIAALIVDILYAYADPRIRYN